MNKLPSETVAWIIKAYDPVKPRLAADALREYWLTFEPNQGINLIKIEQREQQETVGIPPSNPAATWVLCDVIRSLDRKLLGVFSPLLPVYQAWGTLPTLSSQDRRSIESTVKVLGTPA